MRISDWSSDVCSSDLLAPVTRALEAGPVGIDPRICRDRRIEPGEHVAPLAAVLIARDEVGEALPVSRRAAVIDHQRGIALRRQRLVLGREGRALLAVRAAVDHRDQRIFAAGRGIVTFPDGKTYLR